MTAQATMRQNAYRAAQALAITLAGKATATGTAGDIAAARRAKADLRGMASRLLALGEEVPTELVAGTVAAAPAPARLIQAPSPAKVRTDPTMEANTLAQAIAAHLPVNRMK